MSKRKDPKAEEFNRFQQLTHTGHRAPWRIAMQQSL
jgi:hypothetical protein